MINNCIRSVSTTVGGFFSQIKWQHFSVVDFCQADITGVCLSVSRLWWQHWFSFCVVNQWKSKSPNSFFPQFLVCFVFVFCQAVVMVSILSQIFTTDFFIFLRDTSLWRLIRYENRYFHNSFLGYWHSKYNLLRIIECSRPFIHLAHGINLF